MMEVRLATLEDVKGILTIYNDIILNTTAVYDYRPHSLHMRLNWLKKKQEDGFPVFVASENGEIAGFSSFGPFRNWAAYKYSVENSVYVAAAHRGKGIGRLLMAPLIDSAKKMEMHVIIAGIDSLNESSLRLHRSFGFEEVAHFRQVGFKLGKWLDLKFLQLILPTPRQPVES
jgi:phosphinothricin acetyltransferase